MYIRRRMGRSGADSSRKGDHGDGERDETPNGVSVTEAKARIGRAEDEQESSFYVRLRPWLKTR